MHGSQRCCSELTELTVDDIYRLQMLVTRTSETVTCEVPWSSMAKTTICHSKLVLHSLRNNQPVQVVVHKPRQTTLIFPGPCDQMCFSILNINFSMAFFGAEDKTKLQ